MDKKNIRLDVAYDGTRYHGWQRQKQETTIQAVIEDRIRVITGEPVTLIGSGRTDAGVHALHQVCNFITGSGLEPEPMRRGLNSLLPDDIFIRRAGVVPRDFHARYSARSKSYEYRIWNGKERDIFLRNFAWHVREELDVENMKRCVALLSGRHDFSSFRSSGSGNRDPVREMLRSEIRGPEEKIITLLFEASGFLRHMVRNIVGTVVEVGKNRLGLDEFEEIFLSRDRRNAGIKAPPQGLFLRKVQY